MEKQGFEEGYIQPLIERNIVMLKLSRLKIPRLGLSGLKTGVGGGGSTKLYTPL